LELLDPTCEPDDIRFDVVLFTVDLECAETVDARCWIAVCGLAICEEQDVVDAFCVGVGVLVKFVCGDGLGLVLLADKLHRGVHGGVPSGAECCECALKLLNVCVDVFWIGRTDGDIKCHFVVGEVDETKAQFVLEVLYNLIDRFFEGVEIVALSHTPGCIDDQEQVGGLTMP
tara:strand:+ start:2856 stop:3374 length:519 start_codon:yes stop_codon:yes gene_type:complete